MNPTSNQPGQETNIPVVFTAPAKGQKIDIALDPGFQQLTRSSGFRFQKMAKRFNSGNVVEPASRDKKCKNWRCKGPGLSRFTFSARRLEEEEVRSCRNTGLIVFDIGLCLCDASGSHATCLANKGRVDNIAMVEILGPLRRHSATFAQAAITEKQGRRDPIKPPRTTPEGVNEPVVQGREQRA
ncbi:hypothetical protein DFH06DRAFT_1396561 [Mycena polygramma]|nr:hypothetical protein DFH06DRAFT_1396561 [Mycena polygramma]